MIPPPCWCFNHVPAIRMSLMVDMHPIQHLPGLEVLFPVGNPSGMAEEDFTVIVHTALCHSSSSVTVWSGAPEPLLAVCSDSRLLMLLGREDQPHGVLLDPE